MLGQWLNNILLQSTTSKCEAKKEKPDDVVSDDAYTQSLDIVSICFSVLVVLPLSKSSFVSRC